MSPAHRLQVAVSVALAGFDLDRLAFVQFERSRPNCPGERLRETLERIAATVARDASDEHAAVVSGLPVGGLGRTAAMLSTPDRSFVDIGPVGVTGDTAGRHTCRLRNARSADS
jgi:hypothetical protein